MDHTKFEKDVKKGKFKKSRYPQFLLQAQEIPISHFYGFLTISLSLA